MADAREDRPEPAPEQREPDRTGDPLRRKGEADAWNAFSLVISGVVLWGGAGWLAAQALDAPALTGLGLVLGMVAGLALVWLRYGRST